MRIMTLAEVCEINPRKAINLPAESEISFIPMEAVSVCGEIDTSRSIPVEKVKNYTVFCEGDILFAKITPCMENGKGAIAVGLKNGWGAGSTEFIVLRPNVGIVLPQWIYLFLSQKSFRLNCQQNMTGSAGQKRVPAKYLAKCKIPVPPITEQEQILSRSEELFSQLDKGVETLQKTKQQLAVYRQAIFTDAFKGNYPRIPLKSISKAMSGYAFKSKRYSTEGQYTVVKIGNVKPFHFDFSRDLTLTDETEGNILDKYLLKKGDCLITLTGSRGKRDYGFVAMVTDQERYLLNQRVAALRFNTDVALPEFYQYYLSSAEYRNQFFTYETGNVGQGNVGIKALTEPFVVCPPFEKQCQIVTEIEKRLSTCDKIENTVDTALQQAEAMRQSVLKKAFEGRLG